MDDWLPLCATNKNSYKKQCCELLVIFDELQSPGNISYVNCCWVELAIDKVLWAIMPLLLVQVLSKKSSNQLCFLLPLIFFFNSIFLGRESGVYCVPCWFWILEEGTQTETKLNCPTWFLSRWLQSCRNTTTTSRMQQDPDDHSSDSGFFFHAPCDLKERREAWWSLLLQEQDPEDLRCDFRLCSMLPVIRRKEESCSIVFPRTGSRRYLQVWFPTLFYFPRDLKERRDLVHRCSKNRSGKIFAGAISDFVKCSLWSEGK
jgi:hypothetical protein